MQADRTEEVQIPLQLKNENHAVFFSWREFYMSLPGTKAIILVIAFVWTEEFRLNVITKQFGVWIYVYWV